MRPSLLLAVAYERAQTEKKALLESLWRRSPHAGANAEQIEALYIELKADEKARTLLESYKEEAIRSLRDVENANLKGLLRRVIGKIFNDTEIKGWCKEFEEKNGVNRSAASVTTIVAPSEPAGILAQYERTGSERAN
jgi:geranylgeranyl diphosphate synthase type II